MGLSIHYKGSIDRTEDIPQFVDELEDITASMGWTSQRINDDVSDPDFRGIIVSPRGNGEPLCFIFDRQGQMRSLTDLISNQVEPTEYSYFISTKTQFVTVESHVWMIGLLRYLKKHHLSDLTVSDEGDYWETENLETLQAKQAYLQSKIDQLAEGLDDAGLLAPNISVDELIARIEALTKKLQ